MLSTSRYIHLNPLRARMVERPEAYELSSYSMIIGLKPEKLIKSQYILSYFDNKNCRELYKRFVERWSGSEARLERSKAKKSGKKFNNRHKI